MKELKYLQRFFMLLFVGFALCVVQGCGDDDEDEPVDDPNKEQVTPGGDSTIPSDSIPTTGESESPDNQDKPTTESATGVLDGHEYVDLGLSVKWATCNVGASSPEEYGDYFAWGEINTKSSYTEENSVTYGKEFGDISGNRQYDSARANWGGNWRMPTKAEYEELVGKCTWTWTNIGGHNGNVITGPNGNCIFLPAAGECYDSLLYSVGTHGVYWSTTPNESNSRLAYGLVFHGSGHSTGVENRDYGWSVRPVAD